MPDSTFGQIVTASTVATGATGALSGDGSGGSELAVNVDGTTVTVNGSNALSLVTPTYQATVTLSNADILALNNTPIQIVPAPGTGLIAVPFSGTAVARLTSAAYTSLDTTGVWFVYTTNFNDGGAGGLNINYNLFSVLAAFDMRNLIPISVATTSQTDIVNKPVYLWQAAAFTGGNAANTVVVSVTYHILNATTGAFV